MPLLESLQVKRQLQCQLTEVEDFVELNTLRELRAVYSIARACGLPWYIGLPSHEDLVRFPGIFTVVYDLMKALLVFSFASPGPADPL